ncbi:MAG: hypothetical protein ACI9KE_001109 [Polyangiales bacterium]|jgi:hypothetical protein
MRPNSAPKQTLLKSATLLSAIAALLVVACSGDEEHDPAASATSTTPPSMPSEIAHEGPPEAEVDTAAEPETPSEPGPAPVVFGDLRRIESHSETDTPMTLFAEISVVPQPATAPIGMVEAHATPWEVRLVANVDAAYRTVSVVSNENVFEARVTRGRHLHVLHPDEPGGSTGTNWTFLGLELDGCPEGGVGVAGAPVRVRSLSRDEMSRSADAELVALVRVWDDGLGWGGPVNTGDFRMQGGRGFRVVTGAAAWVIRRGEVLHERFHGWPVTLIEAGGESIFVMGSKTESWVSSIDDFGPNHRLCTVADSSGTPLNVRSAPRGDAPIIGNMPNGAHLRTTEGPGSWLRVLGRAESWVHGSGVDCAPPEEAFP